MVVDDCANVYIFCNFLQKSKDEAIGLVYTKRRNGVAISSLKNIWFGFQFTKV
jgi:hypothetical protein